MCVLSHAWTGCLGGRWWAKRDLVGIGRAVWSLVRIWRTERRAIEIYWCWWHGMSWIRRLWYEVRQWRQWRRHPPVSLQTMTSAAEIETSDNNYDGNEESYEDDTDAVSFCHGCEGAEMTGLVEDVSFDGGKMKVFSS
jgi:hypothetical protein